MDIRSRREEVLILRSRDYREQDKLLTVAGAEHGVETVLARGARKAVSPLRALSQPYTRAELLLSPAKGGLSFVQEGVPLESYVELSDGDLSRFAYAAYLCELLLLCWPENKPQRELYALLLLGFSLLKLDDQHERTARIFELRLLREQGWLELPDHCADCRARLFGRRFALPAREGRLLCADCAARLNYAAPYDAGTVRTALRLLNAPLTVLPRVVFSAETGRRLEQLCRSQLDYHLDAAPRARALLHSLVD